ncbi:hypothetical protein [Amycolatopsis sp. DSM 110486]|uniref:Rv1733c family protein n=1 Tax=Amycolatopsis sp. DSM 110486 TaxID=2865832 RepID=UPI001C6A04EC|nr:hypothetical protein [Amycolatopsis sp. DSM 110486]QYN18670.1 hypothetical protein K1T34_39010 [Amycolatopsis sp. DSM 110486]
MVPSANRLPRWWHLLVPTRGSVARTSDRLQAGLVLVVILVALAAVPFSAAVGSSVYASQKAVSVRELAERAPVTATLLADGPPISVSGRSGAVGSPMPTDATWDSAGGVRYFGKVGANGGSHRGDTVQIWVDHTGVVVEPPLSAVAAVVNAAAAAAGLLFAVCLGLALVYGIAVFALNRYRRGKWQQEWFAFVSKKARS